MKTKKEVEEKLQELKEQAMASIKRRYPNKPIYRSSKCSPRIHGRIKALEWVLELAFI